MEGIKQNVFNIILSCIENKTIDIKDETPLLGDGSVLDSIKLPELCLSLEDFAEEKGFEFDWRQETFFKL